MPHDPHAPPQLTPQDAAALPTWRAAYSDRTSALMAAFSQLAYLPFADGPAGRTEVGDRVESSAGRLQLVSSLSAGGFELVAIFNKGDSQAFLAVNPKQFAVLAFRGTANAGDWLIDLNALRRPLPGFHGVQVHRGFWGAFQGTEKAMLEAVGRLPPDLGLYITGHSLGGALAQIASAVLERDTLAACYTFGSPRVATRAFDRTVKCPHYRVVNHWDLVPGVPWATPWGYQHSGDPRLIDGTHPKTALRRDRTPAIRFLVNLRALFQSPLTHHFSSVDDHMIWNYRTYLEAIARARNHPRV